MNTTPVAPLVGASPAPERGDGSLHTYEMLYAGGTRRVYGDHEEDLVDTLIPGYCAMRETDRWQARLLYAIRAQVIAQAEINATEAFATLSLGEQTILQGPRHDPPIVPHWSCRVPLVLISTFYEPAGPNPRPVREQGMEPNIIWVNPSDDHSFLMSLHDIGVISLHTSR